MRKFLSSLFVIIILIFTSAACTRMASKPAESDNSAEPTETATPVSEPTPDSSPAPSASPAEIYPMYDVSKVMYNTAFNGIDSNPLYEYFTEEANTEHTVTLSDGTVHTVLYIYNDKEASISIDGKKTIINEMIPIDLIYDKVGISINEFEGYEWIEVHYLYRVAPDGICTGIVSLSGSESGYLDPFNERVNYDIDDYLNLLGQNEEIITKELGYYSDYADIYKEELHRYLYDRLKIFAYDDEICAIAVSGQRMFGRTWDTFTEDQVHFSEIEEFLGLNLEISSVHTEYFVNAFNDPLEYIKAEYEDYILYFRLWGNNNDEIGLMVVTHKDFDGTLDDALLAMLS